ncbi:GntR family transcriptional regulator [Kitasatospora misakiensis]|uniref:GntR family transcriptional regulator n=1 Tax=Kitasatospora misakiensis TaxID=67330 RepID=A0ABW0X6K1_9ACTN
MALDPDDSRPPYQQVGSSLRASILTKKPGFETGDKLPPGPELAKYFGVARGTVDKALDLLRTEGLIVTRQGSGSFVRERTSRPVGLRPHLEAAFEQQQVTLDFAGFSSETLHNALQEPLDKVRCGRLAPESITGPPAAAGHHGADGRAGARRLAPGRGRLPGARPQHRSDERRRHRPLGGDAG